MDAVVYKPIERRKLVAVLEKFNRSFCDRDKNCKTRSGSMDEKTADAVMSGRNKQMATISAALSPLATRTWH
eukprot:1188720-Prorocentrum_minimum.AAC.1